MYLLSNMAILGIQPLVFGGTLVTRRFFSKLEVGMLKIPNSTKKNNNQLGVGRSPEKKVCGHTMALRKKEYWRFKLLVVEKSIWKVLVKLEIFHKFQGEN